MGKKLSKRATVTVAVAALVVVGGVGGGVAYAKHQTEQRYQVAVETHTTEVAGLKKDTASLQADLAVAETLLAETEGKVAEEATREALAQAIENAKGTDDVDYTVKFAHSVDEAQAAVQSVQSARRTQAATAKSLTDAVQAVQDSHAEFLLTEAAQKAADAKTALDASVAAGEQVLTDSDGKVADNAVREALRTALDAAIAVRDAAEDPDQTVDTYAALAATRDESRATVDAATQVVREAQGAWQAEQDRIAAEHAAAAKAAQEQATREAAARKPAASSKSTSGGSTTQKPAAPQQPAGDSSSDGSTSGGSAGGSSGGNWWDGATPDCTYSTGAGGPGIRYRLPSDPENVTRAFDPKCRPDLLADVEAGRVIRLP